MKRARNIKSPFFLGLPPLKNVGECVILYPSAPGNRMGEMCWHLAEQRVCTTVARRYFFIVFLCRFRGLWERNKKGYKTHCPFAVTHLKNVGECVILYPSAPGNRMGEMCWHLAGQRVCTTVARRFFLLSLLYRLLTKKSSVL